MSDVTIVGLGAMGKALAETLMTQGLAVSVWNRSAEKVKSLVAKGATASADAASAISASELVLISVLDYQAVKDILASATQVLAGRTIVNLTNGTPSQVRDMAAWVEKLGGKYLDGGVMVTPELVGGPEAFVFYSGPHTVYKQHQKVLTMLGGPVYVGESFALAAIYDLALLSAMFGMFAGYIHAAALLRSENIPVTDVTPMIMSMLNAMIELFPQTAQEIDTGLYPQPSSNNTMMAAGLKNILDASREQGVQEDLMQPIWKLFQQASTSGLGDKDISALPRLLDANLRT
ncbi:NAD(P)-dependent oxidoreductase [Cellvibrio sp. ARAG 10.3]|uniref:NAD(P)-dependent oxidoreductase n=1 Tax=Cellvibrio sp. ARAG 10.3 TaxID=3451358 RepID=UPI003F456534